MRRVVGQVADATNRLRRSLSAASLHDDGADASSRDAAGKRKVRAPSPPSSGDGAYRSGAWQLVLTLINCILGASVLGYPYCFRQAGLCLGTLMMAVVLAACRLSYQLLLYSAQLAQRRTFEEVAEAALGRGGRQVVEVCTAALNLGSIVAYLNILADVLSSVAGTIIPPGAEPSRNAYIAGVTLAGALPVALLVRDRTLMAAFSAASVAFVLLFAAVIALLALAPAPTAAAAAAAAAAKLALWRQEGLLVAFPVMVYGFTAHPYYMGVYMAMPAPSVPRMMRITDAAMAVSAGVYWLVGVGGYAMFRSRTAGDVLRNFGGASSLGVRGAYERALKGCYALAILASIPLVILPFYAMLVPLLRSDQLGGGGGGGGGGAARDRDRDRDRPPRTSLKDWKEPPPGAPAGGGGANGHAAAAAAAAAAGAGAANGSAVVVVPAWAAPPAPRREALLDAHFMTPQAELRPTGVQHALVVVLVLGCAMAAALWLPNMEFTFALTGATASVLLAYVLPAVCFLRLAAASELMRAPPSGAGGAGGSGGAGQRLSVPAELRAAWAWRRRGARALLLFGLVGGVLCTHATLHAVREEKQVVALAQDLVAKEVVVADAARAELKAKEAAAAVRAVNSAAAELRGNTSATLGALTQAAAALSTIANASAPRAGGAHAAHLSIWDLSGRLQDHRERAAEDTVLGGVALALATARADIETTMTSVEGVVAKLDASISSIKAEATRVDEAQASRASSKDAALAAAAAGAEGGGGGGAVTAAIDGDATASAGAGGAAGQPGARASEMAAELGKALGTFNGGAGGAPAANATAGRSLSAVRASAVAALAALNQTLEVLEQVAEAVGASRADATRGAPLKEAAAAAMQRALNATAASALALGMTRAALGRAATEETSELVDTLTRVLRDVERHAAGASKAARAARASKASPSPDSSTVPAPSPGDSPSPGPGLSPSTSDSRSDSPRPESSPGTVGTPGDAADGAGGEGGAASRASPSGGGGAAADAERLSGGEGPAAQPPAPPPAAAQGLQSQQQGTGDDGRRARPTGEQAQLQDTSEAAGTGDGGEAVAGEEEEGKEAVQGASPAPGAAQPPPPASPASNATTTTASGGEVAEEAGGEGHLDPEQVARVKGIIANLTALLSANASSADGAHAAAAVERLNATLPAMREIEAAIEGAAQWASGSHDALLDLIRTSLMSSDPSVAARVAELVPELAAPADAAKEAAHVAAAARAAAQAAEAAALPGQEAAALAGQEAAAEGGADAAAAGDDAAAAGDAAGPVVRVGSDGQLVQEDAAVGPVVVSDGNGGVVHADAGPGAAGGGGEVADAAGGGGSELLKLGRRGGGTSGAKPLLQRLRW